MDMLDTEQKWRALKLGDYIKSRAGMVFIFSGWRNEVTLDGEKFFVKRTYGSGTWYDDLSTLLDQGYVKVEDKTSPPTRIQILEWEGVKVGGFYRSLGGGNNLVCVTKILVDQELHNTLVFYKTTKNQSIFNAIRMKKDGSLTFNFCEESETYIRWFKERFVKIPFVDDHEKEEQNSN